MRIVIRPEVEVGKDLSRRQLLIGDRRFDPLLRDDNLQILHPSQTQGRAEIDRRRLINRAAGPRHLSRRRWQRLIGAPRERSAETRGTCHPREGHHQSRSNRTRLKADAHDVLV